MRSRGTTIRRKMLALLLIPLASIVALWAFAAVLTGSDVWGIRSYEAAVDHLARPVDSSVLALERERRDALVYLADPRQSGARSALLRQEAATDSVLGRLRAQAGSADNRGSLGTDTRHRLDVVLRDLGTLKSLRGRIDARSVTSAEAFDSYNRLVDPAFRFLDSLDTLSDAGVARPFQALTAIARATDEISREDALMAAAVTTGHTTAPELKDFTLAVGAQRATFHDDVALLHHDERSLFTAFWDGAHGRALRSAEDAVIAAGVSGAPHAADKASWNATASAALSDLGRIVAKSGRIQRGYAEPYANGKVALAAVAGGAGLLAVIASLIVSARIGRGLIRDLTWLRKEALEASGSRLPSVMRRLAAGEVVDVEAEIPRHEYGDDEIGQVGDALAALQRAAVEGAVRQSELRHGVSEVFVNLARRSQVLLHRQLTLLDTMERRTEDPRELADLFRLDHMTTRMRRHAEGLVILSGAVPSRQWRKPVRLMDVVRAAIAEVEDYERVEVRRMTGVAVVGQAVADLTHLIAELVENGTVFSPPHTMVQVHGEQVASGFVLEIDDRGLGLTPDAMLEANLRLAETPEFELSDTDRLGLFVVSRLAQRQGVRVSLKPSPYGGTSAIVFIPAALLTTGAAAEDAGGPGTGEYPAAGGGPGPAGHDARPEHGFRAWGAPAPAERRDAARGHQEAYPGDSGGLPRRRRRTQGPGAGKERPLIGLAAFDAARQTRPSAGSVRSAAAPAGRTEPPPADSGGSPAAAGGLPRRVRQASLVPQLRTASAGRGAQPGPAGADGTARERSPEDVRARMASLQRGWTRGRFANDPNDARGGDGPGDSAPMTTTEENGP